MKTVVLGKNFNKSVKAVATCSNLEKIHFGDQFNQPIESLQFCFRLKTLILGFMFNQDLTIMKSNKNLTIKQIKN
jgi:hypothetical protein